MAHKSLGNLREFSGKISELEIEEDNKKIEEEIGKLIIKFQEIAKVRDEMLREIAPGSRTLKRKREERG